jgi:septum formation protein
MISKSSPKFILASGSPRRRELLTSIGLSFEVQIPNVDEEALAAALPQPEAPSQWPAHVVTHLAQAKALTIAECFSVSSPSMNALVIAADTTVAIDGLQLGKPLDTADAAWMLNLLQGQEHSVWTGISVWYNGKLSTQATETRVWFRPMDAATIARYVATGEPMDKAGAYAIQGVGSLLVERIEGCYFNVVGLSLPTLNNILASFNLSLI